MGRTKNNYNGLSVLPYDGGTYVQAPFEDCDEETYNKPFPSLKLVNLDNVIELEDNTDLKGKPLVPVERAKLHE